MDVLWLFIVFASPKSAVAGILISILLSYLSHMKVDVGKENEPQMILSDAFWKDVALVNRPEELN